MTLQEHCLEQKNLYLKHAQEFQRIFSIQLFRFWDHIYGFDVIKFDEELICPDEGQSTEQRVRKDYGDRAVELIRILIGATNHVKNFNKSIEVDPDQSGSDQPIGQCRFELQ